MHDLSWLMPTGGIILVTTWSEIILISEYGHDDPDLYIGRILSLFLYRDGIVLVN